MIDIDQSQTVTAGDKATAERASLIAGIKAEASRRILEILPEWKQRNLTAQATILAEKGRANWTAEELAAWDAGEALWMSIAAIRVASDTLEAMDPLPTNYKDNQYWP